MKNIFSSRKLCIPLMSPGLRLGFTLTITLLIISSPIVMLVNPALGVASSNPTTTTTAPSTISQDGSDFTTQGVLSSLTARPTNNIVNTNSFYDVVFLAATSGAIKTIEVTFPAGTTIPSGAFFNEAEKCVPGSDCTELTGTASKSGQTIIYTITNAVNVPAGTKIKLEFANINNPLQVSASYTVTVTTRDAANAIIDGPTQSTAYTMKQIGKNAIADGHITTSKIADNSITSTKPAESFMKVVTVHDDAAGHAVGWDPSGVQTVFEVLEPEVLGNGTFISVQVLTIPAINRNCETLSYAPSEPTFVFECTSAPPNSAILHYIVQNLPPNIIS